MFGRKGSDQYQLSCFSMMVPHPVKQDGNMSWRAAKLLNLCF